MRSISFPNPSFQMRQAQNGAVNSARFKGNSKVSTSLQLGLTSDQFAKSTSWSTFTLHQSMLYRPLSNTSTLRFGVRSRGPRLDMHAIKSYESHINNLLDMEGSLADKKDTEDRAKNSFMDLLNELPVEIPDHDKQWKTFLSKYRDENASLKAFIVDLVNNPEQNQEAHEDSSADDSDRPTLYRRDTGGLGPKVNTFAEPSTNEQAPRSLIVVLNTNPSFGKLHRKLFDALATGQKVSARKAFYELEGNTHNREGFERLWDDYRRNPEQVTSVRRYLYQDPNKTSHRYSFLKRLSDSETLINAQLANLRLLAYQKKDQSVLKAAYIAAYEEFKALQGIEKDTETDRQNFRRLYDTFRKQGKIQDILEFINTDAWR